VNKIKQKKKIDTYLIINAIVLIAAGLLIFYSASLGLFARDSIKYGSLAFKQISIGLIPGLIAVYVLSKLKTDVFRRYAFWAFVVSLLLNLIIFIPGLGLHIKGATRWLDLGMFSFQPSEILKITSVLFLANWFATYRGKIQEFRYGLLPFLIVTGLIGGILLAQPDTDTFVVIGVTLGAVYVAAGARFREIGALILTGIVIIGLLATFRPYVRDRVMTLFNKGESDQTSGYQIRQSLIAIGSGGVTGRGFGQSIQKFQHLPEPVNDSIFAVASEEFGFIGSVCLVFLFASFTLRSFKLATRTPSQFGSLVLVGLSTYIITQSFINISAMIGIIPLSGITLVFVSQGGSALLFSLIAVGIMFNISKTALKKEAAVGLQIKH
jgi:cell division protein FtsW